MGASIIHYNDMLNALASPFFRCDLMLFGLGTFTRKK